MVFGFLIFIDYNMSIVNSRLRVCEIKGNLIIQLSFDKLLFSIVLLKTSKS